MHAHTHTPFTLSFSPLFPCFILHIYHHLINYMWIYLFIVCCLHSDVSPMKGMEYPQRLEQCLTHSSHKQISVERIN